jgi:ATP-dependent RNA helicase SUPV3L1/SUV3
MAKKKNKYQIKLNNKIRNYFDGLAFEDGIVTLEDDKLIELVMLLELDLKDASRDEMIKSLRRVWSQEGLKTRELIVTYLTQPYKALTKINTKPIDKVEKILDILSTMPHSRDEQEQILQAFIDTKATKITPQKVQNKLSYIRHKQRVNRLQKALKVEFDSLDRFFFYESFKFECQDIDFNKVLLCMSDSIDMDMMLKLDDDKALSKLEQIKTKIIAQNQSKIDEFITNLKSKQHRYLNKTQIQNALKSMPPEFWVDHAPLEFEIVESIIKDISDRYHLNESSDHFLVQKSKKYELFGEVLEYELSLSYDKAYIYHTIWIEEELPIAQDFSAQNANLIEHFEASLNDLIDEMKQMSQKLNLDESRYEEFILQFLKPQIASSNTLKLKDKTKRRILFHFGDYIQPLLEKQKREELLAKSIRDFKNLFPLARSLKREIIFHVGPTNSGKTYQALQELKDATTGYYLAPLRLLALEGYESLKNSGINASLITGEEEIIDEESTHISSTIEMMNASVDVDVCVIDEIQMIADRDRGWAWANALIGAPAKRVILTGSPDALDAVVELCEYLGEELSIKHFERKNELEVLHYPISLNQIESKSAVVAFSRKEVLSIKQQLSKTHRVSVVYGNLSPEVRREEARKFRENETDVLVATDAIAMGLNLPIKTILFAKDNKFDGLRRRELLPTEVVQIAGRAGRYGIEEKGYVGAIDSITLQNIDRIFHTPLPKIKLPVSVMASLEHVMLIGEILETNNISIILNFFADNMEFDGPFVAANLESMLEIAAIVDEYDLDLKTKYFLSCAPASISSPYIESVFHRYIRQIEANKPVLYIPPRDLPKFAHTNEMLLNAEDRVREISLYLWLSFKFPELFCDTQKAIEARYKLNQYIENSLANAHFTKKCRKCGKVLDFSYKFSICDECHLKARRGARGYRKFRR